MLKIGTWVRVSAGPFAGVEGMIVAPAEADRLNESIGSGAGAVRTADVRPAGPADGRPAGWVSAEVRAGRAYLVALSIVGRTVAIEFPSGHVRPAPDSRPG